MAPLAGRLDSRRMPIVDLQILGARARITVLIDTGYDGDILCYHDQFDVVATPAPPGARCLVGCRLLSDTRLDIDFPRGDVRISRD